MPTLKNQRHELFAQELAKGKSASEAYVSAGFRPSRHNASRLKTNESVAARLLELQQVSAASCQITIESICRELDEAVQVAKAKGQANPLVSAAGLRAKLGGLLIDKAQIEVRNPDPFEDCHSVKDIAGCIADDMLGGLCNARWLPITDADRAHLAGIFHRAFTEAHAFVDSVNARPLQKEALALVTNGKG